MITCQIRGSRSQGNPEPSSEEVIRQRRCRDLMASTQSGNAEGEEKVQTTNQ